MKQFCYLIFFYLLLQSSVTLLAKPLDTRVVNGKNSTSLFYYACSITMINLADGSARFGGGSIISEKHVLTTASLIAGNKANDFRIDYRVTDSPDTRVAYSEISVIHPNYNSNFENDIAIIFCDVIFPSDIRILIGNGNSVPGNRLVPMNGVGYGITSPNGNDVSRIPYYANTTSIIKNKCKITAPTQYCAYTTGVVEGQFCLGDEGSGLISSNELWNELKTLTLIGMITRIDNRNCQESSDKTQFLSYTPVGLYEKWIKVITALI